MNDPALGWLKATDGIVILVFGVFLTNGAVEIGLAVVAAFVASLGLQTLRRL